MPSGKLLEKPLPRICLPEYFLNFALVNKELQQSDRLILLQRREELYRKLLELSQRQFVESETREWDWLLDLKQECIDELMKLDELENQWNEIHRLDYSLQELETLQNLESLLGRLLESEEATETSMNLEKQFLSKEMSQLRQQVHYSQGSRNPMPGRTKKIY